MARFLNVTELLNYQGDLFGLSETIVELMANHREAQNDTCDIEKNEESAAA